jgi:hypothetical protein
MGRIECRALAGLIVAVLLAAAPALAAGPSAASFHVEWGPPAESGDDAIVRGWVVNDSMVRVGDVRLRVETLDGAGRVVGQSFGWVIGDVPAGGRAWFMVRITALGADYRVRVESYDAIAIGTGDDGAPASPPSR